MLKFQVAPKFMLVLAIQSLKTMVGAIEVIESQPCGAAKVVQNNSTKFPEAQEGDTVFFQMQNCQPVRLENGLMHGIVWEDSILGHAKKGDAEALAKHVPDHVGQPSKIISPVHPSRFEN